MTSFEDSHYILLFRYIYGAQFIQWFCYSKHLHVNCCSYQWSNEEWIATYQWSNEEVLQRHYLLSAILLTSLSIFAQLPTLRSNTFSTKTLLAFWVIPNWFSKFCRQNGYLNSKLMLRWDSPFNARPALTFMKIGTQIGKVLIAHMPKLNLRSVRATIVLVKSSNIFFLKNCIRYFLAILHQYLNVNVSEKNRYRSSSNVTGIIFKSIFQNLKLDFSKF